MSPVIRYDATSGAVLDLLLAGLTNTPALDVPPALSARLRLAAEDLDDDANDRLTPLSPALNPPRSPPCPSISPSCGRESPGFIAGRGLKHDTGGHNRYNRRY